METKTNAKRLYITSKTRSWTLEKIMMSIRVSHEATLVIARLEMAFHRNIYNF
jgi:hypothetical protein